MNGVEVKLFPFSVMRVIVYWFPNDRLLFGKPISKWTSVFIAGKI